MEQQADNSKAGRDGTTERRDAGENTAGGRDYDDAPKKIFARFFRLKKIARGRGFYCAISKFLPDSFP